MHVTTKETDKDGVHILTSVVEADGASELASAKAEVTAKVISVSRTDSGGIQVQTAVEVKEPAPAPEPEPAPAPPTAEDEAVAYFIDKGFSEATAKEQVKRFGVQRVLAMREKELDQELAKAFRKN